MAESLKLLADEAQRTGDLETAATCYVEALDAIDEDAADQVRPLSPLPLASSLASGSHLSTAVAPRARLRRPSSRRRFD